MSVFVAVVFFVSIHSATFGLGWACRGIHEEWKRQAEVVRRDEEKALRSKLYQEECNKPLCCGDCVTKRLATAARGVHWEAVFNATQRMILCPKCGNKRCPKAEYHGFKCSGSNEPGQVGVPE